MNTEIKLMTLSSEEQERLAKSLEMLQTLSNKINSSHLDKYITQEEILKKFGWHSKVLERGRKEKGEGKLSYTKRGGKIIYLVTDFDEWMMRNYSRLEMPVEEKRKYSAGKRNF
jgi:hypothetical protein